MGPSGHLVQFYEADAALLEAVSEYIGAGLRAGEGLEERLRADGLDTDSARGSSDRQSRPSRTRRTY
jgi:hypothetical protein